MEMVDRVVNAMKDKGWSIQVIAIRTGIESEKLRSGKMTEKEENKLLQTASVDAKIDLDLLYEDQQMGWLLFLGCSIFLGFGLGWVLGELNKTVTGEYK